MNGSVRTDLALEAEALQGERGGASGTPEGVVMSTERREGFTLTTLEILNARGEQAMGKPAGRYLTLELDALLRREENAFAAACDLLADCLRRLLSPGPRDSYLVVGLGNRDITPDGLGPETTDCVLVTRHLTKQLPHEFASFRPVSALCTGVLGTTGMESGELVRAVTERLRPTAVIAVDALASREPDRLCRTVQLADTGIVPGSGVGNRRCALNRDALGIPVIAVGVPTVVDGGAFGLSGNLMVTTRDIDKNVRDAAKLIGYGINLALQDKLSLADVDMLLS